MTKDTKSQQIHPRFPDPIIELIDKHAAELQEEARKAMPNATVSRTAAVEAIVTAALVPKAKRSRS